MEKEGTQFPPTHGTSLEQKTVLRPRDRYCGGKRKRDRHVPEREGSKTGFHFGGVAEERKAGGLGL